MIFLYNVLQFLAALVVGPLLLIVGLCREKYRSRIFSRLGFSFPASLREAGKNGQPRIWIHALSVGEVRSSMPLLHAFRQQWPHASLLLSTTTATGAQMAKQSPADTVLAFPFDILPVVCRFIRKIEPDIFILVETDFWPNILWKLEKERVPRYLVNGRLSAQSFRRYTLMAKIMPSVFHYFNGLMLQNREDVKRMRSLGIHEGRLRSFGNLKYDAALGEQQVAVRKILPAGQYMVAGSTHPGEEEIVVDCFLRLQKEHPSLQLVIAPRDIKRAGQIATLVKKKVGECSLYDGNGVHDAKVYIVGVLGQLMSFYSQADIVFVGGSMVDAGGHNPLEAAVFGKPVLFGKYVADFADICAEMVTRSAAVMVNDSDALFRQCRDLLTDEQYRYDLGKNALALVDENRGAAMRTVQWIQEEWQNAQQK